jgi:hypothetical protein
MRKRYKEMKKKTKDGENVEMDSKMTNNLNSEMDYRRQQKEWERKNTYIGGARGVLEDIEDKYDDAMDYVEEKYEDAKDYANDKYEKTKDYAKMTYDALKDPKTAIMNFLGKMMEYFLTAMGQAYENQPSESQMDMNVLINSMCSRNFAYDICGTADSIPVFVVLTKTWIKKDGLSNYKCGGDCRMSLVNYLQKDILGYCNAKMPPKMQMMTRKLVEGLVKMIYQSQKDMKDFTNMNMGPDAGDDLKENVEENEEDIDNLEQKYENLQNEMDDIKEKINKNEDNIDDLKHDAYVEDVNDYLNKPFDYDKVYDMDYVKDY